MEKKTSVIGMPLMAMLEGQDCGEVTQLLVDTAAKRVTHLVLSDAQSLLGATKALPVEKLVGKGRDYLTINSSSELLPVWTVGEGQPTCMLDKDLQGLPVISSQGNLEGMLRDFSFDIRSGAITEYFMEDGTTIPSSNVITIATRGLFVNFSIEPVAMADAQFTVQPQVPAVTATVEESKEEAKVVSEDTTVEAEEVSTSDEEDYFLRKQMEFLLGRTATKDIFSAEGEKLISQGEVVTKEAIYKVRDAGKLTDLSFSV